MSATASQTTPPSFRGRKHSDRRYAPSEHGLRERSPESRGLYNPEVYMRSLTGAQRNARALGDLI